MNLNEQTATTCSCFLCQSMCRHSPCIPTPHEAKRLIDEGYGDRLKVTYWSNAHNIPFVFLAPEFVRGLYCTFQNQATGLCELHPLGLKPIEGRLARHGDPQPEQLREAVSRTWVSKAGKRVVLTFYRTSDEDRHDAGQLINILIKYSQ